MKEWIQIILKLFLKSEEGILLNSFYETSITLLPKSDKETMREENYKLIEKYVICANTVMMYLFTKNISFSGVFMAIVLDIPWLCR